MPQPTTIAATPTPSKSPTAKVRNATSQPTCSCRGLAGPGLLVGSPTALCRRPFLLLRWDVARMLSLPPALPPTPGPRLCHGRRVHLQARHRRPCVRRRPRRHHGLNHPVGRGVANARLHHLAVRDAQAVGCARSPRHLRHLRHLRLSGLPVSYAQLVRSALSLRHLAVRRASLVPLARRLPQGAWLA